MRAGGKVFRKHALRLANGDDHPAAAPEKTGVGIDGQKGSENKKMGLTKDKLERWISMRSWAEVLQSAGTELRDKAASHLRLPERRLSRSW